MGEDEKNIFNVEIYCILNWHDISDIKHMFVFVFSIVEMIPVQIVSLKLPLANRDILTEIVHDLIWNYLNGA